MLSRPNSESCSPQQQWFMWSFFSFLLHILEGETLTSLQLLCQQVPVFYCPHQQFPAEGCRVHLKCALVYKAGAGGTGFAAEELIVSSSPSLNLSSLLLVYSLAYLDQNQELCTLTAESLLLVYASIRGTFITIDLVRLFMDLKQSLKSSPSCCEMHQCKIQAQRS